ncbi:hypothetical protein K1719_014035 [Acacia pycnantha]|nr:hypothetical protein K1719_014035 [Acacia pycnantha]
MKNKKRKRLVDGMARIKGKAMNAYMLFIGTLLGRMGALLSSYMLTDKVQRRVKRNTQENLLLDRTKLELAMIRLCSFKKEKKASARILQTSVCKILY